jgi:hypothetical protein
MANDLKSEGRSNASKKPTKGKLSLYPLSLETALGSALQTGGAPRDKAKKQYLKSVDNAVRKPRKNAR